MIDSKKMNITFTGKEYLEYVKYKDNKSKKFVKENKTFLIAGSMLFFVLLFVSYVVSMNSMKHTESFNFTFEGMIIFLVLCVGLGWIFHGVGFLLVRR